MSDLTVLFEFLSSPNPAARQIALENLIGHTVKTDPARHVFIPSLSAPLFVEDEVEQEGQVKASASASGSGLGAGAGKTAEEDRVKVRMLRDLSNLTRDQAAIAKPALEALINLSPSPAVARHLTTAPFLTFLISYTCNTTSILSSLTSMLLSNISSHHSLLPSLASLSIPLVPFSNPSKIPPPSHSSGDDSQAAESAAVGKAERVEPGWYLPEGLSASSTVHRDYRDPAICPPNKEAGQGEERQVEAIRALVQAFEDGAAGGVKEGKGKRKGECHFLASVFANISTLPSTRPLLLTPLPPFPLPSSTSSTSSTSSDTYEPLLSKIAPFTSHPDTIRRGGALACIKNIALDRGCHAFLLAGEEDRVRLPPGVMSRGRFVLGGSGVGAGWGVGVKRDAEGEEKETDDEQEVDESLGREEVVRGVDVLPAVLGPLMGGEEYDIEDMDKLPATLQFLPPDKQRESDTVLRMMCIEILLLLATTFTGRQTMRDRGTYPVVRELHKWEKDQPIKDAIERLVSLIEGEEGRDTANDHVEDLVKGMQAAKVALPTSAGPSSANASNEASVVDVAQPEEGEDDVVEV